MRKLRRYDYKLLTISYLKNENEKKQKNMQKNKDFT